MASSQATTGGGIGFFGLLTIVFITLKLTHVIGWRWPWVLAALWIPFAFAFAICLIIGIFASASFMAKRFTRSLH